MKALGFYALTFAAGWAAHALGWPRLVVYLRARWEAFVHRMAGS